MRCRMPACSVSLRQDQDKRSVIQKSLGLPDLTLAHNFSRLSNSAALMQLPSAHTGQLPPALSIAPLLTLSLWCSLSYA